MAPPPSHSQSLLPNPDILILDRIERDADRFRLIVHVEQDPVCPLCGEVSRSRHSCYCRCLQDFPWQQTQATYVYGNYIDEVLTMDRDAQTYYYHQNALWSVEAITNNAANVVERNSYDAYGTVTMQGGGIGNPWKFTGRQLDEEAGVYFYRARYYDGFRGKAKRIPG